MLWVYDETTEKLVFRQIGLVPGLFKIFDEILVNAADNYQRDHNMDTLKVTIDQEVIIFMINSRNQKSQCGIMERRFQLKCIRVNKCTSLK